jgi:CelD/BcsL family acetyltransferase involved in cellulose biosynthesis
MIGIAPMMVAPKRILGTYRPRLEFIGDQVNTDSPTIIVNEDHAQAPKLLWRCIASTSSNWDAIYLREQINDKTSHGLAEAIDLDIFSLSSSTPMDAPYVTFTQSWETYFASRSRTLRKSFRRKLRGLESLGELQFHGYADCTDRIACLEQYLGLESKSWKGKAKMGVSGNPSRTSFYRDLAATMGPIGKFHFRFLTLDGQPIAGTIGLLQNGRFESLEICHDQAFDRYSPGVVITGLELDECHNAPEYVEYNFLVGTYSNKRPWQTHARQVHDVYVLPRTAWGNANRLLIFSLKPRLKQLLKRLRLMEAAERIVYKLEGIFR